MAASSAITAAQRYRRGQPCPICGGWDNQRRGKGERCSGYLSADGLYAYCTREEYAGRLDPNPRTSPAAWAHRMRGPCKCGVTHAPALPGDLPAPRSARRGAPRSGASSSPASRAPRPIRPAMPPSPDAIEGPRPAPDVRQEREAQERRTIERLTATYDYRDARGALAYQVLRYDTHDTDTGERIAKRFSQRRPAREGERPGTWVYSLADTPRVLYRLPELLAADPGAAVYLTEGEKCADALAAAGLLATTAAQGAGNWHHTEASAREALAGRPVVVLPDNDGPRPDRPHESYKGQRHAVQVANSLLGAAASVRVLALPGLDPKGDAYDWLADGHTGEELAALADAAPAWAPELAPSIVPDWGALTGEELADDRGRGVGGRGPRSGDGNGGAAPLAPVDVRRIPGTRWYLSPDRAHILEAMPARSSRGGRGEEEGEELASIGDPLAGYRPVYDWPAPTVHALIKFPTDEAPAGRQVVYDIEIDGQRERIAYEELHGGECWGRFGTLGIAGRSAISSMAATVEYIARVGEAPKYPGTRHTGWTLHDGRHALVLPDGRLMGREGPIPGAHAYLALAARHIAPYSDGLALAGDPAAQSAALGFISDASARSLAALVLCAHVRSILYGVLRSDFSVLVRGTSGRGKTSITSYARNLTGDFTGWPPPAATAAFSATVTTVEDDASQIKHLPLTVDDLAISDRMSLSDQAEKAKILDMVLRSVGNNTAVRERMTRTLERQIPRKIDACPVITAERLPEVLASALNRTVLLDIGESDVRKDAMKADSEAHAAGLRGVGHGLAAWIAGEWDRQGEELAASWAHWHRDMTQTIERDLIAARGGRPIPDNATRLPGNGAHLLLAAHALDSYAAAAGLDNPVTPSALYADLIAHLVAQVDTIGSLETGGNDGQPLGEWICEQIREALARGEAHVKNADGSPAIDHPIYAPENLGNRRTAAGDWEAQRLYLANFTGDQDAIAFNTHNLYALLKRAARGDRRAWTISERELGKTLHRAGLVTASDDGHHIPRPVWICGKTVRRLCIPCELIWPEYDDDTDDGPGEELAPAIREAIERDRARERIEAPRIERQEGEARKELAPMPANGAAPWPSGDTGTPGEAIELEREEW